MKQVISFPRRGGWGGGSSKRGVWALEQRSESGLEQLVASTEDGREIARAVLAHPDDEPGVVAALLTILETYERRSRTARGPRPVD